MELHAQTDNGNGKAEVSSDGDFGAQRMAEPIVLTTMVCFSNTFFARGTRSLRPAHQFQNAVVIFDEVQTFPIKQFAV